ncbi:cation/H(+) antiporter 15-like [Malus sylvestris]|uniref:cation/H(+) antiporter 15-like n=1 Tax=Malus sylvestris TaxID=3752 RepID=UPI0021AD319C|nr:cation/H(+) antiporter 15-like [Malus sylvestris]
MAQSFGALPLPPPTSLADLKLLRSEVGRLALSSAVISDLCSWFLFLLGMAAVNMTNMVAVGSTLAFIAVCTFLIRPALPRILTSEREKEDTDYSHHMCFVLAGVMLCGFITDALGSHSIVGPFVLGAIMPKVKYERPPMQYKERNIESVGPETELRILACFHNSDKVSGIINLLEASNPTKQSPIHVLVVLLVELTGHASAMLIVHDTCKTPTTKYRQLPDSSSTSNGAFGNYARKRENITVQKLTAVSAYATMHEDICNLAEENQATLIIIPFHYDKSLTDGATKSISHLSSLNNNLIANAQCSVGVFVDHGFGKSNIITESNSDSDNDSGDDNSLGRNHYHFAMVFIGGTDDRGALTYAWRMAGHPNVRLTVIRINFRKKEVQTSMDDNKDSYDDGILKAMSSTGMEENDPSIKLEEKMLTGWVETLKLINSMESEYDMYIVGEDMAICHLR